MPEPSRMAGVTAINLGSCAAISHNQSPKIAEKVGAEGFAFGNALSAGLNLGTAWNLIGSFSARAYPLPFLVTT